MLSTVPKISTIKQYKILEVLYNTIDAQVGTTEQYTSDTVCALPLKIANIVKVYTKWRNHNVMQEVGGGQAKTGW